MSDNMETKWTDGKPFVATGDHLSAPWNGLKRGEAFRCALCGYRFRIGDTVRWQFTNDATGAGGNPFVCQDCDGGRQHIIEEIRRRRHELKADKWWWFLPRKNL
jgi:hypothetical protein